MDGDGVALLNLQHSRKLQSLKRRGQQNEVSNNTKEYESFLNN
jgi:hypothetical protein